MDTNKILSSDYLDLIYEGRNKSYGGYELRRHYNTRVGKSLALIAGLFLIVPLYSFMHKSAAPARPPMVSQEVVISDIHPHTPVKLPPVVPPPPAAPHATAKFTPPVITRDPDVTEDQLPAQTKGIANPGLDNNTGDAMADPGIITPTGGTGVIAPTDPPKIFSWVEQMPVPGFDMTAFLTKNLHYPDAARENNIEGRVMVKFIISEDGQVSDVVVVRGIGGGCNEEASRVVAAMPPWKPGKQNGKPVKVCFTLPIVFALQ